MRRRSEPERRRDHRVRPDLERRGVGLEQVPVLRESLEPDQRPAAAELRDRDRGRHRRLLETLRRQEPGQERPREELQRDHGPDGGGAAPRASIAPGERDAEREEPVRLAEADAGDERERRQRQAVHAQVADAEHPQGEHERSGARGTPHDDGGHERQERERDAQNRQERRRDVGVAGREELHRIRSRVRRPARQDVPPGRPCSPVEVEAVDPALYGERQRQRGHGGAQEHGWPCREVEQAPLLPWRCEPRRSGCH